MKVLNPVENPLTDGQVESARDTTSEEIGLIDDSTRSIEVKVQHVEDAVLVFVCLWITGL